MRALLLIPLLLASCTGIPRAPDLPATSRLLDKKTTRQLVEHWAGNDYPSSIAGRPVRVVNHHPELPSISALTPASKIKNDDKNPLAIGTLAMAHPDDSRLPDLISERTWLIESQPATILARTRPDQSLQLEVRDFRDQQTLNGRPLASRFDLPFEYIKDLENAGLANLLTLINPENWSERRGFYLATPYHPDKIPLIFVHGLLSTPVAFEELAAAIAAEPDLWDRYQLIYYFYPTGNPWVLSAANFREDFRNLLKHLDPEGDDIPLRTRTTIIAHSMGGLITRLSLSENPEILYTQYFSRPLDTLRLPDYQKKRIRQQLLFEPLQEPSRVIFLATPHKGSKLAGGPLLWLARKLVKTPARILGTTFNTAQILAFAEPGLLTENGYALLTGNEVSVSELNPDNPALAALEKMPVRPGVKLHNIIASVTGDPLDGGDLVVPLSSARLNRADTEVVVKGNHWLVNDPKAHAEVIKLLRSK